MVSPSSRWVNGHPRRARRVWQGSSPCRQLLLTGMAASTRSTLVVSDKTKTTGHPNLSTSTAFWSEAVSTHPLLISPPFSSYSWSQLPTMSAMIWFSILSFSLHDFKVCAQLTTPCISVLSFIHILWSWGFQVCCLDGRDFSAAVRGCLWANTLSLHVCFPSEPGTSLEKGQGLFLYPWHLT